METDFSNGIIQTAVVSDRICEGTMTRIIRLCADEMTSENKMSGECSTSYIYILKTLQRRIHRSFNPKNPKLLSFCRNPVERAVYLISIWRFRWGWIPGRVEEAMERDFSRSPEKGWGVSQLYFELGEYGTQLKALLRSV